MIQRFNALTRATLSHGTADRAMWLPDYHGRIRLLQGKRQQKIG